MTKQKLLDSIKNTETQYASETGDLLQRAIKKLITTRDRLIKSITELDEDKYSEEIRNIVVLYKNKKGDWPSISVDANYAVGKVTLTFYKDSIVWAPSTGSSIDICFPKEKTLSKITLSDEKISKLSPDRMKKYYIKLLEHKEAISSISNKISKLYELLETEINKSYHEKTNALKFITAQSPDWPRKSQHVYTFAESKTVNAFDEDITFDNDDYENDRE